MDYSHCLLTRKPVDEMVGQAFAVLESRMKSRVSSSRMLFEPLEERRLLAVNWGAFPVLIGQNQAVANHPAITGAGSSIAILDSGMNYNDPALGGGFGAGHKVIAGYDFVDNDTNPMDSDGHGTGLASVAAASTYTFDGATYQGIAPGADLIALRVDTGNLGWNKEGPLVKLALQWVIDHRDQYNIVAVNMSFGQGKYSSPTTQAVIGTELAELNQMGVLLVAASGNDGATNPPTVEYPAADPNVYAVGSVNSSDVISSFSSRSADLDILAPGENVPLIYYLPSTGERDIFPGSGTSFSTAFIAGMAALLKQIDPTLTGTEMMSIMERSGSSNFDGDKEAAPFTKLTFPRLNVNAALNLAFAEQDDSHENNDTLATATTMTFSGGQAALSNLKSLIGDADFYKFTIGAQSDVVFSVPRSGGSGAPAIDLLNSSGSLVQHLADGTTARLGAGTYYVRVNAPAVSLAGTYGVDLSATPAVGALPPGANASSSAIAYDAAGNLHLAYYDESTKNLKYAKRSAAGVWGSTVVVDAGFMVGQFVSLAIDSAGRPGIAYYDANNADLKYAHFNGSAWVVMTVDSTFTTGYYPSLKYDSSDAPIISYYYKTGADLKFAVLDGGTWNLSTIDSANDVGRYSSLALNPTTGRWSLAYEDTTHGWFKYADQTKKGWGATVVDNSTKIGGGYISLAFNAQNGNRAAFSYYDAFNADLKYASFNGSSWVKQTVASKGTVGLYSNLLIDPSGAADILYYSKNSDTVSRAVSSSTGWSLTPITTDGGRWISRAVDLDDTQTLSYLRAGGLFVVDI
jgi:hypothetical protein